MIWLLEEHDRTRVSVTALTANLARSPATVSQAIRGLTDAGLIRHNRYGAITLTSRGRDLAITAIRQERITRAFPFHVLSWPWPQVAEEAARLGPALNTARNACTLQPVHPASTPTVIRSLIRADACPSSQTTPLGNCPGATGLCVTRVEERDQDLLERFHTLGLTPGAAVRIRQIDHATGIVTVSTGESDSTIGLTVASRIHATADPDNVALSGGGGGQETGCTQTASVAERPSESVASLPSMATSTASE